MARVSVDDAAWVDPRFTLLGRALGVGRRYAHAAGLGVMAKVWSQCTERGTDRLATSSLAVLLDIDGGRVVDVLCDVADLGELVGDGVVRVRGCGGRIEWLADLRTTARAGGVERASTATRDDAGRFRAVDGLVAQVLAAVAKEPLSRRQLRAEVKARRGALLEAVRALVNDGLLVEGDDGMLSVPGAGTAEPVPGTAEPVPGTAEPVPGTAEPVHGTAEPVHGTQSVPSAPAPAPAPAREQGAHTRRREPGSGERVPGTDATREYDRDVVAHDWLSATAIVPREDRRDVARALWVAQNEERRRVDKLAPVLPLVDLPGGSLDAVVLALARYTPRQCVHALEVFRVEAECRSRAGDDALAYLNGRTNWKDEQLSRAVATTPEAVKRRFRRQGKYERAAAAAAFEKPEVF